MWIKVENKSKTHKMAMKNAGRVTRVKLNLFVGFVKCNKSQKNVEKNMKESI